jgi:hypothetical protein
MDSSKVDRMLFKFAELAEVDFGVHLTLYINGVILNGYTISTNEYVQTLERNFTKVSHYDELPESSPITDLFNKLFDQIKNNFSGVIGEKREEEITILHLKDIRYKIGDSWGDIVDDVIVRVKLSSVDGFAWAEEGGDSEDYLIKENEI